MQAMDLESRRVVAIKQVQLHPRLRQGVPSERDVAAMKGEPLRLANLAGCKNVIKMIGHEVEDC